jgi:hypothetical protein
MKHTVRYHCGQCNNNASKRYCYHYKCNRDRKVTVNLQPSGVSYGQGQSLIVIEGGDDGTAEQENATTTFVDISRTNPEDIGSRTQVVFFSTNSTGQLAFLDNILAISQIEFSPE